MTKDNIRHILEGVYLEGIQARINKETERNGKNEWILTKEGINRRNKYLKEIINKLLKKL